MYESDTTLKTFGERLKSARYEAGLLQGDLATSIGVSTSAVQSWEQGTRMPRANVLHRIAEATGKPLAWFFAEVAA